MSNWRIAKSLEVLRLQLNALFPNRSKASDGGIGDASHQSRSNASDHNPHVKDKKGVGVVTAFDFTHDAKNGIDCNRLAEQLVKSRDKRIKYIIWNKQILSSKVSPWVWRTYSGTNAHTKHLHISVDASEKLFDDVSAWQVSPVTPAEIPSVNSANLPSEKADENSALYTVKAGDTASEIAASFGIGLATLKKLNGLDENFKINIGQQLKIK